MKLDTPGTVEALRRNFEHYTQALHRYLTKRARRGAAIDDLSQEVHARVLKIEDSKLLENPLAYLYGIAHNVVIDLQKEDGTVALDTLSPPELEEQSSLREDDSSDRLNLQQQVKRALAQLPDVQAQVLLCTKLHGMTYDETAQHLGLTLGQVRHHFVEANRRFKNTQWDR